MSIVYAFCASFKGMCKLSTGIYVGKNTVLLCEERIILDTEDTQTYCRGMRFDMYCKEGKQNVKCRGFIFTLCLCLYSRLSCQIRV